MRKRPFNRPSNYRQRYGEYLDNVSDTQSTLTSPKPDDIGDHDYISVPPASKQSDVSPKFITFRDFSLTFKTIGMVCSIFLIVVIPLVWFFSNLNTNVQTLRIDVDNMRNKIENLWVETIQQRAKIDAIEKHSSDTQVRASASSPLNKK